MQKSKRLALKVDVDTLRGTRIGVPSLIEMLKRVNANATFLFSLGPDHTGRAIKRVFRKGFLGKVKRTSVVQHYGFPTLLYGTLLPGPDIGKRAADILRRTRDEGFECGIHTWDHVKWQDGVVNADAAFAKREMRLAQDRFTDIFKEPAKTHGSAGWQMSRHALRLTQQMGFDYCSDGRACGSDPQNIAQPHYPVVNAEIIHCPQIPTTLPTLDELIGTDTITADNVTAHLLNLTEQCPPQGHVFTLHAELEGMALASVFEKLLTGWIEQGYELVSTRRVYESLDLVRLPCHHAIQGEIPGRSGTLLLQGAPFLPPLSEAA